MPLGRVVLGVVPSSSVETPHLSISCAAVRLALIYGNEARWENLSAEAREREMGEYMAISAADVTVAGNELDGTATATTVRVRGDETLVTDGPFAELKEALGGYYVFECDSIDDACTPEIAHAFLVAARADFLRRLERNEEAAAAYRDALTLAMNAADRTFLEGGSPRW